MRKWTYQGKRTVGPYINDNGWRRMVMSELYTVILDIEYTEMFEYERKRAELWEAFIVKVASKVLDSA